MTHLRPVGPTRRAWPSLPTPIAVPAIVLVFLAAMVAIGWTFTDHERPSNPTQRIHQVTVHLGQLPTI